MALRRFVQLSTVTTMLLLTPVLVAQTAYPRPPGANTTAVAPSSPAAATPVPATVPTTTTPAATPQAVPTPVEVPPVKAAKEKAVKVKAVKEVPVEEKKQSKEKKEKHKKAVYSGPNEIVVLPPTAMMDENGKPSLDPDGKPIFNAPKKQQRDKKGHPLFDENGKPIFQTATVLGYDDHGKKIHVAKVKPPKLVPVHVTRGTFTVDGITGKAALNYDIPDLKYLY
ncbi:MAG: hypothetical protein ABI142_10755, partial [Bryocella sp.]